MSCCCCQALRLRAELHLSSYGAAPLAIAPAAKTDCGWLVPPPTPPRPKWSAVRGGEAGQPDPLGPQWDCIQQLLDAMPKRLLAQAASRVR